ncbi:uncharacterized protein TRIADDRAFT_62137 [Trichoplax adhaerens]|uniref:G-protein coupled receptors family 1 profile domain-containing protein n=1 Tax=Trichoplax adhaerens TaxID=10228 RepID=B3SCY2_TRIAD|nr:hypothetical protein TRIADDRAFT_62137 [Trichoplax adhaerens]EDV19399.1 hypothetical protein TRIADDRAFT_62137 [Trichoplax adhaerens]|eukprot:XP_002118088.1 hypothetical protein TRIADDRAFT_62137 [Trichoplax adhaerens]
MDNCSDYHSSQKISGLHPVYGILSILGIIGNGIVYRVIRQQKGSNAQSAEIFITSLAVADMLTGLFAIAVPDFVIPYKYYHYPSIGLPVFCAMVSSQYFIFYFGFISLYTIAAISFERWCAIAVPSSYRCLFQAHRTKRYVMIIWLVGLIFPIDNIFKHVLVNKDGCGRCRWTVMFNNDSIERIVFLNLELIRIFLPTILIVFFYSDIARRIWSINSHFQNRDTFCIKITVMAFFAAFVFLLCWIPNELYFTLVIFKVTKMDSVIHRTTKSMIILNSCLNPIIYMSANSKYRKCFRQWLLGHNRITFVAPKMAA